MSLNTEIIRSSFEKAKPIAEDVANKFYEILFRDHPEVKPLFESSEMDKQKKALLYSLTYIVDNIENTEKLVPYLRKMGARHTHYDVSNDSYVWVGESLLKTFAYFFGADWTPELESQWVQAYNIIATVMQEGAEEERKKEVVKDSENVVPFPSPKTSVEIKLPEIMRTKIREHVRVVLWQAIENEVKAIIDEEIKNLGSSDFLKKVVNL